MLYFFCIFPLGGGEIDRVHSLHFILFAASYSFLAVLHQSSLLGGGNAFGGLPCGATPLISRFFELCIFQRSFFARENIFER